VNGIKFAVFISLSVASPDRAFVIFNTFAHNHFQEIAPLTLGRSPVWC
jgi:hypothetical protein